MELYQENLQYSYDANAADRRGCFDCRVCAPNSFVLCYYFCWPWSLHFSDHLALHCIMPSLLLLPMASGEFSAACNIHGVHQLCSWIDMCIYKWKSDPRVCDSDNSGGSKSNSLHILGCKERARFRFLGPFLFAGIMIIMVFALIQLFFPMGRVGYMVYGVIASLIFCGYIIYDTDNLIKRYSYDEYVWASVSLYLDIINLFLSLLTLFRAADS